MRYIKVWSNYDFNGKFGANNDEDVFALTEDYPDECVNELVIDLVAKNTGYPREDLGDFCGWYYIDIDLLD